MEGNGIRMGKTLGIDRETARRIKRMSRQELDGYLSRLSSGRNHEGGRAVHSRDTREGKAAA